MNEMDWDLEDFIEEVKFQMTEYDDLGKEKILEWEEKARSWILRNKNRKSINYKSDDEIYIPLKSEDVDVMEEIARVFHLAVKRGTEEEYWNNFKL